jgi:adenylate cyclase
MHWLHLGKIRLHPGISTAFLLLMVPSILGIVWFVYAKNSAAITELAGKSMQQATASAIEHTIDHLDSVGSLVSTIAAFGEREPESLQRPDMGNLLLRVLRAYPQIDSLYAGFKDTGNFAEAVRLPGEQPTYGPNNTPIPRGAIYVVRYLDRAHGRAPSDRYSYLTESGSLIFDETSLKVTYDPRARPFYQDALARPDAVALSDVYAFASTGNPGITISRVIRTRTGEIIGAAGADFTIDNISGFLRSLAPSEHGVTLIVDDRNRIVAYPGGNQLIGATAGRIGDPALASALAGHTYTGAPARIVYNPGGAEYSASFTPFPASFGKRWELMIVVPTDDFVGSLKRTTREVLVIGLGVLIVGIIGIRLLSKGLTRPIEVLIAEAERIRRLELEGEIKTPRAAVREVVQLIDAVRTMKAALHSFALFVPRTLVHDLLSSGRTLERGGENRVVTVLFTDLVSFSTLAESVSAADLAARTSDYLEDVTQEVIRYRGTIDKYIGDAVMALWNAPVFDEDHIAHACYAALHAQMRLERSNRRWVADGWPPIAMRIGIHTNDVVVGIIGSTEHMSYTALGDGVNIASRLEGINKIYGTQICVSHTIYKAVSHRFLMRPLDYVAVKGRKEPIVVYELMAALDDPDAAPTPQDHEKAAITQEAFTAWRQNDVPRARQLYGRLLERFPDDAIAQFHMKRCDQQLQDLVAPPLSI